jgi:hypothetical protein
LVARDGRHISRRETGASKILIGVVSLVQPHDGLTTFQLQTNPNGYFVLSAKGELYVAWIGEAVAGNYPIQIHRKTSLLCRAAIRR